MTKSIDSSEARDFQSQTIDAALLDDLRQLVRLAIREDLDRSCDLTTLALVPAGRKGVAALVARVPGVASGVDLIPTIIDEMDADIVVDARVSDMSTFSAKQTLATLQGPTRDLLTCERTILNFLGRLCGIATLADRFVQELGNSKAKLYDTRKTTPGWRRLEKYATRCGRAQNHRSGLYDAILIKDNHLACRADATGRLLNPSEAIAEARRFIQEAKFPMPKNPIIEIEVDSIEQLELALSAEPDIVLLDNMTCDQLRECVALRNHKAPNVQLEASGGVNLRTVTEIGTTGVDRISVGAITHSAVNLDLGLDWLLGPPNPDPALPSPQYSGERGRG